MNKGPRYSRVFFIQLVGLLFLLNACSITHQTNYFQDLHPGESEQEVVPPLMVKIRPGDQISILVNSRDPQLTNLLNLPTLPQQVGQVLQGSGSSRGLSGYTVDDRGEIGFPVLGKIRVAGKSRSEIAVFIKDALVIGNYVKDPVVTVEFMSFTISVLGEVNNPGRFNIDRDQMTLLDVISMTGDLTIYGKRDKVMVLREENGAQRVYGIDLCSVSQMYASLAYNLQQDDVIYTKPNTVRARQSTVNGNNVRSTPFWISLASLLTTISVLVLR